MNKNVKKTLAAGVLATSLLANNANVSAYVPQEKINTTVEDDNTVIERTSKDWQKILADYTPYNEFNKNECNLDVQAIYDIVSVAEFITENYEYYVGEPIASYNVTVDDVISYKRPTNTVFNYDEVVKAYINLNKEDDKAVYEFLVKYGKYLPEINAHIRGLIVTLVGGFRNNLAWYVKQDIQNTGEFKDSRVTEENYIDGELASDISVVKLHYPGLTVAVDITAPNEGDDLVGDGYAELASVHEDLLKEYNYFAHYMKGILTPEEALDYIGADSFTTSGTTIDAQNEVQETYQALSDQELYDLVRRGLATFLTISPATTYDYVTLYDLDWDVTALGYGHWFIMNEDGTYYTISYDENGNEVYTFVETFERPTESLTPKLEEDYKLVKTR